MKRDFDLIRKILLYVEKEHDGSVMYIRELEDYPNLVLMDHCQMLIDQGLLNGKVSRVDTGEGIYICKGLAYEGYEFLDKIRDNTRFKKTIKTIIDEGKDMTATVIAKVIEDQMGI